MRIQTKDFSHVANFTGYMAVVADLVASLPNAPLKILDMPAGNGLLSDHLRKQGHDVVSADINDEKPNYVCANMEQRLPFEDGAFDVALCLEGVEHVIEPHCLIAELCRVVQPGGYVLISMPNVQSLYSRLVFLFTGTMYQFDPAFSLHPRGREVDRGHISPVSLVQLDYLFGEQGLQLQLVAGDKIKKKILLPLYALLWLGNRTAVRLRLRAARKAALAQGRDGAGRRDLPRLYGFMLQKPVLLSRSLITVWRRP